MNPTAASIISQTLSLHLLLFRLAAKHNPRVNFHRHTDTDQRGQTHTVTKLCVRSSFPQNIKPLEHIHHSHHHATVPDEMMVRLPVSPELVSRLWSEQQSQRLQRRQRERCYPEAPV